MVDNTPSLISLLIHFTVKKVTICIVLGPMVSDRWLLSDTANTPASSVEVVVDWLVDWLVGWLIGWLVG